MSNDSTRRDSRGKARPNANELVALCVRCCRCVGCEGAKKGFPAGVLKRLGKRGIGLVGGFFWVQKTRVVSGVFQSDCRANFLKTGSVGALRGLANVETSPHPYFL